MHHVAAAGGVNQNVRDAMRLKQLVKLCRDVGVAEPLFFPELHRERRAIRPLLDKTLHAVKILCPKIVVHLQEEHAQFLFEESDVLHELLDLFVHVLEPRKVRDALVELWKVSKILRHTLAPCGVLLFPVTLVECGV